MGVPCKHVTNRASPPTHSTHQSPKNPPINPATPRNKTFKPSATGRKADLISQQYRKNVKRILGNFICVTVLLRFLERFGNVWVFLRAFRIRLHLLVDRRLGPRPERPVGGYCRCEVLSRRAQHSPDSRCLRWESAGPGTARTQTQKGTPGGARDGPAGALAEPDWLAHALEREIWRFGTF